MGFPCAALPWVGSLRSLTLGHAEPGPLVCSLCSHAPCNAGPGLQRAHCACEWGAVSWLTSPGRGPLYGPMGGFSLNPGGSRCCARSADPLGLSQNSLRTLHYAYILNLHDAFYVLPFFEVQWVYNRPGSNLRRQVNTSRCVTSKSCTDSPRVLCCHSLMRTPTGGGFLL